MALSLYGYPNFPHDFGVTRIDASASECPFSLDFSRSLGKIRWFGINNKWIGPTVALEVPIIHQGEQEGGYKFLLFASEPYFKDIQKLWKDHRGSCRLLATQSDDALQIVADFGKHFPDGH